MYVCLIQRNAHSTKHDDCVDTMQINRSQSTSFRAFCCTICCFLIEVVQIRVVDPTKLLAFVWCDYGTCTCASDQDHVETVL